ncbi:hypothetical protein RRG08_057221, partial [Elysia crispata]
MSRKEVTSEKKVEGIRSRAFDPRNEGTESRGCPTPETLRSSSGNPRAGISTLQETE